MSDVRVTTGNNYNPYSNASTLTVPTAPLTKGSYTRLLLNGTNAAMIDQTGNTNIETIGNAQLNTSIKKFGTASAKFDETGDYLLVNYVHYLYKVDFKLKFIFQIIASKILIDYGYVIDNFHGILGINDLNRILECCIKNHLKFLLKI